MTRTFSMGVTLIKDWRVFIFKFIKDGTYPPRRGYLRVLNNSWSCTHINREKHSSSPPATRKVYWARNSPSVEYVWLVQIVQIFAVHCENLVPRPKYLGPSSSNIQYLTRPDQKLSKNIYFIGSEWYISLYVLGKSCSVSHLQQLNLGQNYLTKIGARPDKFCHKNDPGVVVLA